MILNVSIQNFLTFKNIDLPFSNGLIIFSGESGSGKSIFMEALSMLLGKRADYSMINPEKQMASISAVFQISLQNLPPDFLSDALNTVQMDNDQILATRLLEKPNKSRITLNNIPVTGNFIGNVLGHFIEIQNQFSQNRLMDPKYHLTLLDAFADLSHQSAQLKKYWDHLQHYKNNLQDLQNIAVQQEKNKEHIEQSILELESLNIQEDEELLLIDQKKILSNAHEIINSYTTINNNLFDPSAVMDRIRKMYKTIGQHIHDQQLKDSLNLSLDTAQDALNTLFDQIEEVHNALNTDPDALNTLEDRLHAIRFQARKYQTTSNNLPEILQDLQEQLESLENMQEKIHALQTLTEEAEKQYTDLAKDISQQRIHASQKLENEIIKEFAPLKLETMQFKVLITEIPASSMGYESVKFTISTHPDFPLAPIHRAASGGELSRFFLAFWLVMAKNNILETLVFDEVDAGVGGRVSTSIGKRLAELGKNTQVICITHSPQVAAFADQHIVISKNKEQASSSLKTLNKQEQVDELANMLSGTDQITKEAFAVAQQLIQGAYDYKNNNFQE